MRTRQPGFTMVEMLVVIVVIAFLGGLVLPVLSRARECGSRGPSCGGNCGNLIKCCHLYSDASTNLGSFPLFNENHNGDGQQALAKLFDAYVRDHRVYSCRSKTTNTSVLAKYLAPDESTLIAGYTNYGYDPGHLPTHATAGVVGDMGVLHPTNHKNSTNHGADGPGQNVALGSGSVEWWDTADARPTKDGQDCATTDDIYADDIKEPDFPEELETNIIR
jgi:prepilin-type N-terminal cleavage/methylation domain-containing protein